MNSKNNININNAKIVFVGSSSRIAMPHFKDVGVDAISYYESFEQLTSINDANILYVSGDQEIPSLFIEESESLSVIGYMSHSENPKAINVASRKKIPIFNAAFSSVRSTSEYIIATMIFLMRNIFSISNDLDNSFEVRGKTLGIVGYGRVGVQLSILAEALGMNVVFCDQNKKLPIGNSIQLDSINELLSISDVVSINGEVGDNCFYGRDSFSSIKNGAVIINTLNHSAIDLDYIREMLFKSKISGFGLDLSLHANIAEIKNTKYLFANMDNAIITVGKSHKTIESTLGAAREVSSKILNFVKTGDYKSSVNQLQLKLQGNL